ncbi:MAG: hypothetical protein P1U74_01865 [Legionellaceae bacterium]|nr:hypothetical protein [Legionellaceae bacterium]
MSYNKVASILQKTSSKLSQASTRQANKGFGYSTRVYARGPEKEIYPPMFPKASEHCSKLAFLSASMAIVGAKAAYDYVEKHGEDIMDDAIEGFDTFMKADGNKMFLNAMANETFRESVYAVRNAELLHHGIKFEENDKNTVFYRGMALPAEIEQDDAEKVREWQDSVMESVAGRGFSPLLWITRASATREQGLNIHPHDGNCARASAPDAPPSWSADVMAMTCDFERLKGYCKLDNVTEGDKAGCIILAAPKRIHYLSSGDVGSRHTEIVDHEHEVIAPYIDSNDTLAVLFVEDGKISRVEVNADVLNASTSDEKYEIDILLVKQLREAHKNATQEVKGQLESLINTIDQQKHKVDLDAEFNSRFHDDIDSLIDYTKKSIAQCDAEIASAPGLLGMGLRAIKKENKITPREVIAEKLQVELPSTSIEEDVEIRGPLMQ